jgi:OmpA-OmpF porin, OOP family
MRPGSILPVLALCLGCGAVQAQPIQGIYIGVGAGLRIPTPTKNTPITPGISSYFDLEQNLGYAAQLSIGYALGNGWRFELEGNYGRSDIGGVSGTTFPAVASGRVRNLGFMTNAVFDMDVGSPYIYPYLGLGFGYQSTRLDGFTLTRTDKPFSLSASGQAGGFAAQSIVGVSLPIPNVPGLSVTVDYRFMDITGGEKFNGTTTSGPPAAGTVSSATKFHNQFIHNVLFGVRYAFNTPPPAAVAPQAMAAPPDGTRTYQVQLGLDVTTLSDRAREIVKEAARESGPGRTTRIAVATNDHALAERGARTVAAALAHEGVPRDAIAVQARGDMKAGTRDPRVEIVTE